MSAFSCPSDLESGLTRRHLLGEGGNLQPQSLYVALNGLQDRSERVNILLHRLEGSLDRLCHLLGQELMQCLLYPHIYTTGPHTP